MLIAEVRWHLVAHEVFHWSHGHGGDGSAQGEAREEGAEH